MSLADKCMMLLGSRYIFDLYYEKEAISKQLYDWLLKNGYADGNLIAKWKKQGYEKVRRYICGELSTWGVRRLIVYSYAACAAYRQRRRILMRLAFVECLQHS